jgi:hypothetical protein
LDVYIQRIKFLADVGDGEKTYSVSDVYKNGITPGDVVRELSFFDERDVPIVVIDEYNLVKDKDSSRQMAETIKAVSDDEGHGSIDRCSEEILMPRMNNHEMQLLIESRVAKLEMKIEGDAKWKIVNLSKGLPAFAHSLGKGSVLSALDCHAMQVKEFNVDHSIAEWLGGSQNTLKGGYEQAIRSNQQRARFRQILTAMRAS